MSRTLISRGLAVVFAALMVLGVAPGTASARPKDQHGRHHVELTGTWNDPGAILDGISPTVYPTQVLIPMHGGTIATGGFAGTSTYVLTALFDTTTNVSVGNAVETYTAGIAGRGSGHVTFDERVQVNGDGTEAVTGTIIAGDGVFAGARGYARFTGNTDPTGPNPGTGPYRMWIDLAR
jgi:hypothetical protein